MKILLINKYFYGRGGAETVFFQERDFLLSHGHEVSDFSMHHNQNIDSPFSGYFVNNIEYRGNKTARDLMTYPFAAAKFISNREAVRNLKRLLVKHRPEIAHLHNIYHQLTPSIIPVLKDHGIKVVLTVHDYKIVCPNYKMLRNGSICSDCLNGRYWNCFLNRCEEGKFGKSFLLTLEASWHKIFGSYEGVDLFIVPSKFLADLIEESGIPSKKIRVLPNGINHKEINPYSGDEGYILYFGRISKEKGLSSLLQAYTSAKLSLPLKIVGTGPLLEQLTKQYKDLQFLGFKSGSVLHALIAGASFVVVPSEGYENCSMSVLEAMAYGKPVIGTRIGGIPEQIEDGKSGFLFERGNTKELARQLSVLAKDIGLRRQLGTRSRQKILEKFTLKRHCDGLMKIYKEALL